MKSLVQKNFDEEIEKEVAIRKKQELLEKLESIVGTTDDTLQKLVDTYEDADKHASGQALQVRLDIIKYINQLKGIDVDRDKGKIQIAIFNYGNKDADLEF